MSKYHELTEKLWIPTLTGRKNAVDRIVREWLADRAERLTDKMMMPGHYVEGVLGLTEKEEVAVEKKYCPHVYESDMHGVEMIKAPNGEEFAVGGTDNKTRYKFDPWCGKEIRPSEPSKRGKLAKIIQQAYLKSDYNSTETSLWLDIADAVIEELNIGM